jgi:WG repeat protein
MPLMVIEPKESYGLIDYKGNIILDLKYNYLSDYHDGKMFSYRSQFINNITQHEYGIINDKGAMVIKIVKPQF